MADDKQMGITYVMYGWWSAVEIYLILELKWTYAPKQRVNPWHEDDFNYCPFYCHYCHYDYILSTFPNYFVR